MGVELHRVGNSEIAGHTLRDTAVGIDAPDLVGAHHREVQQAVRADLHGVGRGQVARQHSGCPAVEVQLQQSPAVAAFTDEQPALVKGDAVG